MAGEGRKQNVKAKAQPPAPAAPPPESPRRDAYGRRMIDDGSRLTTVEERAAMAQEWEREGARGHNPFGGMESPAWSPGESSLGKRSPDWSRE